MNNVTEQDYTKTDLSSAGQVERCVMLLPCPFCGGDAEIDCDPMPIGNHYRYSVYAKHLPDCYLSGIDNPLFETPDDILKEWNKRAT